MFHAIGHDLDQVEQRILDSEAEEVPGAIDELARTKPAGSPNAPCTNLDTTTGQWYTGVEPKPRQLCRRERRKEQSLEIEPGKEVVGRAIRLRKGLAVPQ